MENHKNIIILIAPWSHPPLRERSILRTLFEDLRSEEFSVLLLPPLDIRRFGLGESGPAG